MRTFEAAVASLALFAALGAAAGCGVACNPSTCYEGCCSADGRCMVPTAEYVNQFCGQGGGACQACSPNEHCQDGACAVSCTSDNCAGGCCGNGVCRSGGADDACGLGGGACQSCKDKGANYRCSANACATCVPSGQTCFVCSEDCCSGSCAPGTTRVCQ